MMAGKALERLKPEPLVWRVLAVVAGCYLLVFSAYTVNPYRTWLADIGNIPTALRTSARGGESKAWLRLNATAGQLILSTGDNQIYYISHLNVAVIPDQPALEQQIFQLRTAAQVLEALRPFRPKYLLNTDYMTTKFWNVLALLLSEAVKDHPESLLYVGHDSYVVDFNTLDEAVHQACAVSDFPRFLTSRI